MFSTGLECLVDQPHRHPPTPVPHTPLGCTQLKATPEFLSLATKSPSPYHVSIWSSKPIQRTPLLCSDSHESGLPAELDQYGQWARVRVSQGCSSHPSTRSQFFPARSRPFPQAPSMTSPGVWDLVVSGSQVNSPDFFSHGDLILHVDTV